jgi:putative SOS response-associated peptidase YedK
MCGRFAQTTPSEQLVQLFKLVIGVEIRPRFNLAPTQSIVAIRTTEKGAMALQYRWGLVPSWADGLKVGSKMINARAETIFDKRSFAKPARHQRCVIPSSGFYEWQSTPEGKRPTLFTPKIKPIFNFAGLWSAWADDNGFIHYTATILTTQANETMAPFHHRMPVILGSEGTQAWLDPSLTQPAELRPWLRSAPNNEIAHRTLNPRINHVGHDDPECWNPL